jgi:DNA-binding transcriptional regulator LsrR (DeoR family)
VADPARRPAPGPRELVQLATVASRYYLQGRSKVEIAEDLGVSRFKVARMIDDARQHGVVRIDIAVPDSIDLGLSNQLTDTYGLRQAIVVDTPDEPVESLRAELGRVAADLLFEIVEEDAVVGLGWGRTLNAMTASLRQLRRCAVVQLTGALSAVHVGDNSIELVRRMSEVSGGPAYPIYAPLILSEPAVAKALRSQPEVAEAISCYDRVAVAIVPVGSWEPPQSQLYDAMDDDERRELLKLGVRADTCGVMFAADGDEVRGPLNDRIINISGEQLRRIPEVVAVAGGRIKAEAIAVVLRAGFITTLVTNSTAAHHLLNTAPTDRRPSSASHD